MKGINKGGGMGRKRVPGWVWLKDAMAMYETTRVKGEMKISRTVNRGILLKDPKDSTGKCLDKVSSFSNQ